MALRARRLYQGDLMPASPLQWEVAIVNAQGHLQGALSIARALATGKSTLVGLPQEDQRYQSDASTKQINDANRDLIVDVTAAIDALRDAKAIP